MNAPIPARRCPHTDDVIARHLDGDVNTAGASWRSAEELAEHLRDCAVCQVELQRSRRLDAALAEASGRATIDLEQDAARWSQLLARAVAAAAPPAPIAPAARRQPWRLVTGAGLVLLGLCLARVIGLGGPRGGAAASAPPPALAAGDLAIAPAPDRASEPPATAAAAAAPAAGPGAPFAARIELGGRWRAGTALPSLFVLPRARAEMQRLADVLGDRALADREFLLGRLRHQLLPTPASALVARSTADDARLRCSQLLLDAATAEACVCWAAAIARLDGGPLQERVLADARRRPGLLAHLRARLLAAPGRGGDLGDLAALVAAARLGGRELDGALRQLVRRSPGLHEDLAAALRQPGPRPGRAALLLDVGGDLAARGRVADDERLARALFAGQPAAIVDELAQELAQCRQESRRVRCLLALGAVGDAQARPWLLAALKSASLPEALAAAFALAQLPRDLLADLRAEAHRPGNWPLRAALCCAGVPGSERWIEALELSPAERRLLAAGGFTFAQFPVFAALLRERSPAAF